MQVPIIPPAPEQNSTEEAADGVELPGDAANSTESQGEDGGAPEVRFGALDVT